MVLALSSGWGQVMKRAGKPSSGFTLIEAMIALAVFAIVAAALSRNASLGIQQTVRVEEQVLAWTVAKNALNELLIPPREAGRNFSSGRDSYTVSAANRKWQVNIRLVNTEDPDLKRVEVSVMLSEAPDRVLAALTGFLGKY